MKHPEFYRASRKWLNALYLSVFSVFILGILSVYFNTEHTSSIFVSNISLILLVVALMIAAYTAGKMMRLIRQYKEGPR